jgi:hypothetical protein
MHLSFPMVSHRRPAAPVGMAAGKLAPHLEEWVGVRG